jgi:hypothetical protein
MVGNNYKWFIGVTYGGKTTIEDMQVVQIVRDYHGRYAYMVDRKQYRLEACKPHWARFFYLKVFLIQLMKLVVK